MRWMKLWVMAVTFSGSLIAGDIKLNYRVDISEPMQDRFYVTLAVKGWSNDSAVFQFASTAPGTYQVMDVGRFVNGFTASDSKGKSLPVVQRGINQYVINDAKNLATISYRVEDVNDTNLTVHPIYPMAGSNIEKDNALINGQMVFGYFHGYQANPIQVQIDCPKDWKVATALTPKNGLYTADSFDHIVDSPFLLGRLTEVKTKVGGAEVGIYCYSQNNIVTADSLLEALQAMLVAAEKFLGELPVKRYAFLYHFRQDVPAAYGAWEHSYSSEYVMPEKPMSVYGETVKDFSAHEFFHIVTPLNIHSEIIQQFNFVKPTPSDHLWLYEATTEWASHLMQVRGGMITSDEFTERITNKLVTSDYFRSDLSLVDLARGSFGDLAPQYGNIYIRGALTMMLFDMRLLELTVGKMGLNDLVKKLAKQYGPKKAFPEKEIFDIVVKMTHPDMKDFIDRYIKGYEPLPVEKMLNLAGYAYHAKFETNEEKTDMGKFDFDYGTDKITFKDVDASNAVTAKLGLQNGDAFLGFIKDGTEFRLGKPGVQKAMNSVKPGDEFGLIVQRGSEEIKLTAKAGVKKNIKPHFILPVEKPTSDQLAFRKRWLSN